jgi:hypothetical protein
MGLIAPDRGKITLDLFDGQPPLELWMNQAALDELQIALGMPNLRLLEAQKIIDAMATSNLHLYFWAGERWRGVHRPTQESYKARFMECAVPSLEIFKILVDMIGKIATGRGPETDPGMTAAASGNGNGSSDSPSLN